MVLTNQIEGHCLKVLKVYDWVTRPVNLQVKKILEEQPKFVKDEVCGNIGISCGETSPVWEAADGLSVSGSVTVFHHTGCEQMEVIVNGSPSFFLKKGKLKRGHSKDYSLLKYAVSGAVVFVSGNTA